MHVGDSEPRARRRRKRRLVADIVYVPSRSIEKASKVALPSTASTESPLNTAPSVPDATVRVTRLLPLTGFPD